jgi:hypothetical protein
MRPELYNNESSASPLLKTVCHLVGSQSYDELGTQNDELYEEVKKKLSLIMLNPPLDTADLWAMLVLSTWNLGPANSGRFIDSWLLSGSTLLYSSLTYDFSSRGLINDYDSQDPATKNHILAWNASALLHLKYVLRRPLTCTVLTPIRFSVGTGKPCVFETDTLSRFMAIVRDSREASRDDRSTAIELDLYEALYKGVVQLVVHIDETKAHLQRWEAEHGECSYHSSILRHFPADFQSTSTRCHAQAWPRFRDAHSRALEPGSHPYGHSRY